MIKPLMTKADMSVTKSDVINDDKIKAKNSVQIGFVNHVNKYLSSIKAK